MKFEKIAILGAGTMGSGIAHVIAQSGYQVIIRDIKQEFLDKGLKTIRKNLERGLKKGRITEEEIETIMGRIKTTESLEEAVKDADLVIEAIPEKLELKLETFKKLDKLTKPDTILASNTSSISITKLAAETSKPDKVLGLHFFNPAPVMKLVEVIRGEKTSDDTMNTAIEFAKSLGKTPVRVKEFPGFIVNKILITAINEAIDTYERGIATAEDIDTAMKLGCNWPMGPLELADYIGLDVVLDISKVLKENIKDFNYRVPKVLEELVSQGKLGRKSGEGFYKY